MKNAQLKPKNQERIERIRMLLDYSAEFYGDWDPSNLTDLLIDLFHYCQAEGINFETELRMARCNYEAESGVQCESVPISSKAVLHLAAACFALVTAYENAADRETISSEEVDTAHEIALAALKEAFGYENGKVISNDCLAHTMAKFWKTLTT